MVETQALMVETQALMVETQALNSPFTPAASHEGGPRRLHPKP